MHDASVTPTDLGANRDRVFLSEIAQRLWHDKSFIAGAMLISAILASIYALQIPNKYQASILLRPQGAQNEIGGLARQYGGLANLAGINLASTEGSTKTALALEVISSKRFSYDFATRHSMLPKLFAAESWAWETQILHLDPEIYDDEKNKWVRQVDFPRKPLPSPEELHELWGKILSIKEDKKTGFIKISATHISPIFAKELLELLITDINETLRAQDLNESKRAISYLNEQIKQTNISEIRELLTDLLRSNMEAQMMATVEPNYIFSIIDPPTVPEQKSEPIRALFFILGALIGLFTASSISILFFIKRHAGAS